MRGNLSFSRRIRLLSSVDVLANRVFVMRTPIVFLGGLFSKKQMPLILAKSKGNIQNAADVFQKNIVYGLSCAGDVDVMVINLPFVTSYPKGFRSIFFPSVDDVVESDVRVKGFGFINLRGIRSIARLISALYGLLSYEASKSPVIVVYSAHLPFMYAALLYRHIRPNTGLCLILPDLPEYMGTGGVAYRFIKSIESKLFYSAVVKFDWLVPLTSGMINRISFDPKRSVVVEGMVLSGGAVNVPCSKMRGFVRYIFYSGTLAERYNILDLVEAFSILVESDVELWICGEGDARPKILQACSKNPRIKYLGQLKRDDVLILQAEALLLVNPRKPGEEYTKYSFPSKTMEYLVSGRPVVMYKLEGIPCEYYDYILSPKNVSIESLSQCLAGLLKLSDAELCRIGMRGRDFVLNEKNSVAQARKIIDLIGKE